MHREEIKETKDEIYRTQGKVITEVNALARVYSAGCRFVRKYWENWGKDDEAAHCKYWVLGEISKKFTREEMERIGEHREKSASQNLDHLRKDFLNSDLTAELRTDKDKYLAGDTVLVYLKANYRCYAYLLDFYEEGKVEAIIDSYDMSRDGEYTLTSVARYGTSKMVEVLKLVVADRPLDIEKAMAQAHAKNVIEHLRAQAEELKARYAEKSTTIIIESR